MARSFLQRLNICSSLLTIWKLLVEWNSHCIISKKIGMVAFRSSVSGISVISKIGPTISGMNLILCWPLRERMDFRVNKQPPTLGEDNCYNSSINKFSYSLRKSFLRCDSTEPHIIIYTKNPYLHAVWSAKVFLLKYNLWLGEKEAKRHITCINLFRLLYLVQRTKCSPCQSIKVSPRVRAYTAPRHETTSERADNMSPFFETWSDWQTLFHIYLPQRKLHLPQLCLLHSLHTE